MLRMNFVPFSSMTFLIMSMGPYLYVATWIVNKGVVKLFKPFFQLVKQRCLSPLSPYFLIWAWVSSLGPFGIFHLKFIQPHLYLCILVTVHPRVDVNYDGSILAGITLFTSPYNFFLNDSNGHGCYFKKLLLL